MTDAGLERVNALGDAALDVAFERCCGARRFVSAMRERRPFASRDSLHAIASEVFRTLGKSDILEAFEHHPRIGDVESLKKKFATTASWASNEQAGAAAASDEIISQLADGNRAYEARFGHIFIVCATGKTAAEMLALLQARIGNPPDAELAIAAGEQEKITHLRLDKLLDEGATA